MVTLRARRAGVDRNMPPPVGEPLTTASGGSFVRGEVSRNKRSPQWGVAPIEAAGHVEVQ